jgi:Fe-S oxidoreductase
MAGGRYNAAYKTFKNAVGFPEIVAALCSEYCAAVCPRKDVDAAVQLNLLERTCVTKATRKDPPAYNLPIKEERIGIIGGGMSGLACALRLASKKYRVTVFEKTDRLGGRSADLLPAKILEEDIRRQFQHEKYDLRLNTEIKDLTDLKNENFAAVYGTTGSGGSDFGVGCFESDDSGTEGFRADTRFFAGGGLTGKDVMHALADGLDMAWAIEVYLKTGKKEYPEKPQASRVVVDLDKLAKMPPVFVSRPVFTDEEAVAEAKRCIRCQCDACKAYCDLSAFTGKWPREMRDDIMTTVMASESMIHKTPAVRLLNMCTQCRCCDEGCPEHIQLGGMIKEARHRLHQQNKMPGAYHQFWLNDMDFSNSEFAMIRKAAPGHADCAYAFFPGCHLSGADPEYVTEPYHWLLGKDPGTGLLLRCCGVPADWAGNDEMHDAELAALKSDWTSLGCPTLITTCPSCERHLAEYLPEIKTISLYERLLQLGYCEAERRMNRPLLSSLFSVFDPCSARDRTGMQDAVRKLAEGAGLTLEELPKGDKHGCCGFGGNVAVANPAFAEYIGKARSGLRDNPYIVYCINCREVFQDAGKKSLHLLDILFDINTADWRLPDFTQRRANKILLKEQLLKEVWGEEMSDKPEAFDFKMIMVPEIREKMNRLKLLESDLGNVLAFSLQTKRRTYNAERDVYRCYRELGHITCWLEYRPHIAETESASAVKTHTEKGKLGIQNEQEYEIVNIFTHRMKIEIEAVWNGRKTDADLR